MNDAHIEARSAAAATARPTYHHGNLRQALIDAVGAIVRDEGLDQVSIRACAKLVGVAPSAAFRHFADKRDLMSAYAAAGFAAMARMVAQRRDAAGPEPVDKFRAVGEAYILYALENPGQFQAMFRSELVNPSDTELQEQSGRMEEALRQGLRDLVPGDEDPVATKKKELLAWAAVHGLSSLMIDGQLDETLPRQGRQDILFSTIDMMRHVFAADASR